MNRLKLKHILCLMILFTFFTGSTVFADLWIDDVDDIENTNTGRVQIWHDMDIGPYAHFDRLLNHGGYIGPALYNQPDIDIEAVFMQRWQNTYLFSNDELKMFLTQLPSSSWVCAGFGTDDPDSIVHVNTGEMVGAKGLLVDCDGHYKHNTYDSPFSIRVQANGNAEFNDVDHTHFIVYGNGHVGIGPDVENPLITGKWYETCTCDAIIPNYLDSVVQLRTGNLSAGEGIIIDSDGEADDTAFRIRAKQWADVPGHTGSAEPYDNADTKFIVTGDGNVGLGDDLLPDSALEVDGDIRLSGVLKAASTAPDSDIQLVGNVTINGNIKSDGSICIGTCP